MYNDSGVDIYDIQVVHETNILKLLEFTRQLVTVLGQGFSSYYTDRYVGYKLRIPRYNSSHYF